MGLDTDLYETVDLSREQELFLEEVDAACQAIRSSEAETWINEEFNEERIPHFAEHDLLGIPIPDEYGGRGMDAVTNALALMRIGMEGAALRTFFSVHVNIGQFPLYLWGTEEQKNRYLPDTTSGGKLMGFALTEPGHGSNPAGMETTYREEDNQYVLNGEKTWIGNGSKGDLFSLFAKHEDTGRIAAFLVEADAPGFSAEEITDKIGYRNSNHGTIHLENCEVPVENVIPPRENGLTIAYTTLLNGRLSVAAGSVGVIHDCIREATAYAKKRVQWGEEIGKKQAVQTKIGEMTVKKETAQQIVLRAAEAAEAFFTDKENREKREQAEYLTSVAKAYATEAAYDAADTAVQIFGSKGYTLDNRAARHLLDERATRIYEGTTDIHLLKLAAMQLGDEYSTFGKVATPREDERF